MPATIRQVLEAVEARLATIPGLRVTDYAPGQVNPPAAVVTAPPVESYRTALTGRRPVLDVPVLVLVSAALDRVGQYQLAEYADPDGPRSVPAVVAADRQLGGVVSDCEVTSFEPLGLEEVGVIGYFGGRFTLRIIT